MAFCPRLQLAGDFAIDDATDRPSLEALVESGLLHLESLHPGGMEMVRELADLCGIQPGSKVLDVAAGTGETACYLVDERGAQVTAIDASPEMVRRAQEKAQARGLVVDVQLADAARLPFADGAFDIAICECTLCLLDKQRVIREMLRVVRPGGCLGMHDLCWQEDAPEKLRRTLADIEGERPETQSGWERLFAEAELTCIRSVDKSAAKATWMRDSRRQLGLSGQLSLARYVIGRWGLHGLWTILRSDRVFSSKHLGYALLAGTKP